TDTNGMWVNANTGATTTFTRFDNINFSAGTGTALLQIYAKTLYLASSGCTFDSGVAASTTYSVKLTGDGASGGDTPAVFGGSTCSPRFPSCQASKSDADNVTTPNVCTATDGIGDNSGNGAVVQFVRGVGTDTVGVIEGFPTAAFDWSTFTYYSTYAAFH